MVRASLLSSEDCMLYTYMYVHFDLSFVMVLLYRVAVQYQVIQTRGEAEGHNKYFMNDSWDTIHW